MLSLTLKELLEGRIVFLEADDISDNIRLVFWKENEKWREYCFCREKGGTISLSIFKNLLWIRNTDKKAIVMNKFEFMISGTDDLIDIDRMVHVVEKEYNKIDSPNNINKFLIRTVKITDWLELNHVQFLGFNREEFFQTELGKQLIKNVNRLQDERLKGMANPLDEIRPQAIIATIFLALKQFYNVDWDIISNNKYYRVVENNTKKLIYDFADKKE